MAYTGINKSSLHMNTKLYTGNGGTQALTGINFRPDWVWTKRRDNTGNHSLYDVVRGVTKRIESDTTDVEQTLATGLTAFGADGFTLGSGGDSNGNNETYASWNWKAGNSAGSANTDGSINSTVSVNTISGFSIVRWSGSSANATIGHGLNSVPKMIICKDTSATYNWGVYHANLGNTKYLYLNSDAADGTSTSAWNDTTPTSTVFSVGNAGATNASGTNNMIAYCFAEKPGFSKFSSFVGNGDANGTFCFTGMKPNFLILKRLSSGMNWQVRDSARSPINPVTLMNKPNANTAEQTADNVDFLSNGFKLRTTAAEANASGSNFIYMAFGQSLVGSNNVPCTAR